MRRILLLIGLLCAMCYALQAKNTQDYLLVNTENSKDTVHLQVSKRVILITHLGDTPVGFRIKEVLDEGTCRAYVVKRADTLAILRLNKKPKFGKELLEFDSKTYSLISELDIYKRRTKLIDVLCNNKE